RVADGRRAAMEGLEKTRPGEAEVGARHRRVVLLDDLVGCRLPRPRPVEQRTLGVIENRAGPTAFQHSHVVSPCGSLYLRLSPPTRVRCRTCAATASTRPTLSGATRAASSGTRARDAAS